MPFAFEHSLQCRKDFPALNQVRADGLRLSFLDGPGGSQVPQSVIDAITDVSLLTHNTRWGYPSSGVETGNPTMRVALSGPTGRTPVLRFFRR